MTTLSLYIPREGLEHQTGSGHPESPERLQTVLSLLAKAPYKSLRCIAPNEAELKWIRRAHDSRYIERIEESIPDHGQTYLDNDTVISPGSWSAALTAAGAVCQAVDDIIAGQTTRAFCAVRPPGHHAFPDHAEGFCLFNNIFIGALHAQALMKTPSPLTSPLPQAGGRKEGGGIDSRSSSPRIAIVDFDVHHGNGSDAMARKHENVFYASTHQWPLYPGTGLIEDNIPNRILNIPMSAGDGSARFREIYSQQIFPAVRAFNPDLLMISAGFDAHKDDPLAQIELGTEDFGWVTAELAKIANECCGGKIVSVLEGGYNLAALSAGVDAHLRNLMN